MSWEEASGWEEYFTRNPPLNEKIDDLFAMLCAVVNRGAGGATSKDFRLRYGVDLFTPLDQASVDMNIASYFGGLVKR